jgi:hypothetical protein
MYPASPAALQGLPLTIAAPSPAIYSRMVYADPYTSAYNSLLSSMYSMNVNG